MSCSGFGSRGSGFAECIVAATQGPEVRWRDKLATTALTLTLSLTLACASKVGPTRTATKAIFLETGQAPGWTKTSETRAFPPDRLYEYIDGDAEKYIQAGVEQTLTADYRYGEKIDAVADVFVMSRSEGATKVFESQPATGSQPVRLGDAGRLYRGSVTFRKGRYFIRLVAFTDSAEVPNALVSLGGAIATRLE